MGRQAHRESDPETPVQDPLPGCRPPHERQVLTHPGEHGVTFPIPQTKDAWHLSALVSKRARRSPLRSRFPGHGRTSCKPVPSRTDAAPVAGYRSHGPVEDRLPYPRDRTDLGYAGSNNSTTFPAGSSIRICLPPGPVTISLRKLTPSPRSLATSLPISGTIRWMRFQPPGPGLRPSGIGLPAELPGPASSNRRLPEVTSANAGAKLVRTVKPRWLV